MDFQLKKVEPEAFIEVPVWSHDVVQDEKVDRVGLPIAESAFDQCVPFRVIEEEVDTVTQPLTKSTLPLHITSTHHGRSTEVGTLGLPLGLWSDEHGNQFSSLSIKGANGSKPSITESSTAPSGFLPYGLQEDDALVRVLRASRILRESGVAAEWVTHVLEPKAFPLKGQLVGEKVLKQHLIEQAMADKKLQEKLPKIADALGKMAFFVTVRSTDISERIWDFQISDGHPLNSWRSEGTFKQILSKTFRVYNLTHSNDANFAPLDLEKPEDVTRYTNIILPTQIGENYRRLHSLGLAHKFAHFGNITMLGGIVDLDSMHGEALNLGDAAITHKDIITDVERILDEFANDYGATLKLLKSNGLADGHCSHHAAEIAFLKSYIGSEPTLSALNIMHIIAASPSVHGHDFETRNEGLLSLLRKFRMVTGIDNDKLVQAVDETLKLQSELVLANPRLGFSSKADELIGEELNGTTLEELIPNIAPILDKARQSTAVQHRNYTYGIALNKVARKLKSALDKEALSGATEETLARYCLATIASHIDPTHPTLQPEYYMDEGLESVVQEYVDNLSNQHDIAEIPELMQHGEDVGGVFAGKKYYLSNPVALDEVLTTLQQPEKYEIHYMTNKLDPKDEWSWLKPQYYFSDGDGYSLVYTGKHGHYQQVPSLKMGGSYAALGTEKDVNGKHHVMIWQSEPKDEDA